MFTGIVEEVGKIRSISEKCVYINCNKILEDVKIGDSISVNGVCLTVTELGKNFFKADVSPETLRVTTFNTLKEESLVNLERAMAMNGRFGGHMVSGHVDGKGKIIGLQKVGDFYKLELDLDSDKYIVQKGSIAVDGISLTIAEVSGKRIAIAVIPHTVQNTRLKVLKSGDFVNIEVDILAKYVEKFLSTRDNRSGVNIEFLQENGFF